MESTRELKRARTYRFIAWTISVVFHLLLLFFVFNQMQQANVEEVPTLVHSVIKS